MDWLLTTGQFLLTSWPAILNTFFSDMRCFSGLNILTSMPFEPDNGIDSVLRIALAYKSSFASGFCVPEMSWRKYKCRFA